MKAVAMPLTSPMDVRLMNGLSNLLWAGLALGVVWMVASWMSRLPLFALAGITITGDILHTNSVTLKANVTPKLTGSFFTVDLQHTQKVFQQLPWVRRAVVEREFPNRLRVHIEEHQPVAFWGVVGDERLLNSHGEIFEPNLGELETDDLPRLSGPDNQSMLVLQTYAALREPFAQLGITIGQLELSPRGSWRVKSIQGAVVELGRGSLPDLMQRYEMFAKSLPEATQRWGRQVRALEQADLRHFNGYALRLRGVSTVDPQKAKK
ncbi:MAG: cell division protein FtsQ/DivIB [Alphaproteobacteria bacterium]|nr:cell division protein FtsQ/DivIB [Alphaproteobacteria bacterium]MDI9329897.1 cell division protein FtsQ/DivIB [Alphaproteobacteria bacterium]